jgi:MoaA/NifB/PqqE/SkfB family radical SAM enzyme
LTILQSLDLPRKVYVEPTNACNLACETCMRHVWDEREGFMDWQTFSDLLHGFARLADRSQGQPTVAFMGLGEPAASPSLCRHGSGLQRAWFPGRGDH